MIGFGDANGIVISILREQHNEPKFHIFQEQVMARHESCKTPVFPSAVWEPSACRCWQGQHNKRCSPNSKFGHCSESSVICSLGEIVIVIRFDSIFNLYFCCSAREPIQIQFLFFFRSMFNLVFFRSGTEQCNVFAYARFELKFRIGARLAKSNALCALLNGGQFSFRRCEARVSKLR